MKHDFARRLRREQTKAEQKLWYALRDRRLSKFKFRRQQPLGPFVADFVCFEKKLIVELDGDQHALPGNAAHDKARTTFLAGQGFRVLRFWNIEVNEEIDYVLHRIGVALGVSE